MSRGILVDDDTNRHVGADHLPQGGAQPLGVALLKPRAGELVLNAHDEDAVVGQLHRSRVLEPRLEARRVELTFDDVEDLVPDRS